MPPSQGEFVENNVKRGLGKRSTVNLILPFIFGLLIADCFHEKFDAVYQQSTGTYTIKCSKLKSLPPLILDFDSITVELPADVWTGVADAGQNCCHTKIRRGSSEHDWVLGTTFTHAFYSVFDSEKDAIGFGLLKGSENGVKIQVKK